MSSYLFTCFHSRTVYIIHYYIIGFKIQTNLKIASNWFNLGENTRYPRVLSSGSQLGGRGRWRRAPTPEFRTLAFNRWATHFTLWQRPCITSAFLLQIYLRPPLKLTQLRPCCYQYVNPSFLLGYNSFLKIHVQIQKHNVQFTMQSISINKPLSVRTSSCLSHLLHK